MPVNSAMNIPIGMESTPSRRICTTASGTQVRTSRDPRAASATNAAASPTRSTRVRVVRPTDSTRAAAFTSSHFPTAIGIFRPCTFAFSVLGRVTVRMPLSNFAAIFSASTSFGSVNDRWKEPYFRSHM